LRDPLEWWVKTEVDMALTVENAHASPEPEHYWELVQKFPLRPLRSDQDLDRAVEVIDSLIIRGWLKGVGSQFHVRGGGLKGV